MISYKIMDVYFFFYYFNTGAVILLHDTTEKSIAILEQLLLFLHKNGYQSVTVDTLFNIEAYD